MKNSNLGELLKFIFWVVRDQESKWKDKCRMNLGEGLRRKQSSLVPVRGRLFGMGRQRILWGGDI